LDARFINPVLLSILNVLKTMANIQPSQGKPSLKTDDKALGAVTGVIDMNGKQATGSIAISFSKPAVLDIGKRMLRTDFEKVDEQIEDLVGEIANMMAGGAKANLENDGFDFELSLPNVKSGDGHLVAHSVTGPTIVLPFTTESGDFFVEICFK